MVPFDRRTSLSLKLLLVELPATLEVMFLNAGIAFLIHLSSHVPTTNFENRRNGGVCNTDVTTKTARTSFVLAFVAQLIDQVMHHYSGPS